MVTVGSLFLFPFSLMNVIEGVCNFVQKHQVWCTHAAKTSSQTSNRQQRPDLAAAVIQFSNPFVLEPLVSLHFAVQTPDLWPRHPNVGAFSLIWVENATSGARSAKGVIAVV